MTGHQAGPHDLLLLDDDAGILRLQRKALEAAGYRVTAVQTAEAAREQLRRASVALLVLDYRLEGGQSGLEFYQQLRREGSDVPAVLVTAFSDERKVLEALRAGVRDVIPKSGEYLDYLPEAVGRVMTLIAAERQANENEALRRFLATLAHELRNPLAPIRYALSLLDDVPPPYGQAREVIDRQLGHLVRLVDDLLDISRITRDKMQLRPDRVELAPIMRAAVESVQPAIDQSGVHLTTIQPPDEVWLDADAARLTQVFTNLLNNAVKYTPPSGWITFTAAIEDDRVRVSIADSGSGIAAEHLPHVFDMFYQAPPSGQHAPGGLGIGLMLVRRLVEMHGGEVQAHSEGPGCGAEFTVTLPLARPAGLVETGRAPTPDAVRPPSRLRVLVVDDNHDSAELLALVVRRLGHEVETAHDAASAIAALRRFHPAVGLLDIGLPGGDGYELARQFRQDATAPLFLIAITGWGQEEDRRRAREAGFDYHLVKPASPLVIERLISCFAGGEPCGLCVRCVPAQVE